MKYRCEFCGTMWRSEDLRHHPHAQVWVNGELVECPYCCDEQRALDIAYACLAASVKPKTFNQRRVRR